MLVLINMNKYFRLTKNSILTTIDMIKIINSIIPRRLCIHLLLYYWCICLSLKGWSKVMQYMNKLNEIERSI